MLESAAPMLLKKYGKDIPAVLRMLMEEMSKQVGAPAGMRTAVLFFTPMQSTHMMASVHELNAMNEPQPEAIGIIDVEQAIPNLDLAAILKRL